MAVTFAPTFTFGTSGAYRNQLDNIVANAAVDFRYARSFTSGTGVNQVDICFDDTRSVANGSPDDLDLAGGLVDIYGNTLTFAKIKAILIVNKSTTVGEILSVGGNASNQFINWVGDASDIIKIGPGGFFGLCNPSAAGYAVTASSGDILQIASDSGTISYRIQLWGIAA